VWTCLNSECHSAIRSLTALSISCRRACVTERHYIDACARHGGRVKKTGCEIPVVFYIYYNLIYRYGIKRFAKAAAAAGVDGVLTLDLPPEEAAEYDATLRAVGVHPIYLIAPTTPEARIAKICRHAGGFIYYVSRRRRDRGCRKQFLIQSRR